MKILLTAVAALCAVLLSPIGAAADDVGKSWLLAQSSDVQRLRRLLDPPRPGTREARSRSRRPYRSIDPAAVPIDPAARLGLPPNAPLTASPPAETAPVAPVLPPEFERLDSNRDGAISRDEYFRGRARQVPAGPAGAARQSQMIERLDSRFRHADRDRDGTISAQELQDYANPRF